MTNVGTSAAGVELPRTREERAAWVKAHGTSGLPPREPRRAWLCAPVVAPLIERLSKGALGWCNATAATLRAMIWVDTGYTFGERSIPRFIRREHKRGKLRHEPVPPGWYFWRTKRWSRNGTQLNRYPSEGERREGLWRAKVEKRRQRRDAARAKERARDERARAAREERRAKQRAAGELASALEVVTRAAEQLATPAETRSAIAGVLATLARPMALRPASPLEERPPVDWRARALEEQARARAWLADQGDDDDGET